MKPIKLSMAAFGPYAAVQEIDFRELGNRNLFLIHGPTGAGKTTILDGICFALYGDTSGAERNGKNMRSHHADPDQRTEVTFEFEIRTERYRVQRIPEQERPKRSGSGTTLQNADATLWKLKGEGNEKENEVLLKTGWKNVTEEIERLLGFKSSQFRQVIMLPQGQFRKLLTADSLERQNILEKLFHTELYRIIEELLKKNAKELKDEIKRLEDQQNTIFIQTGCENMEDLEKLIVGNEERLGKLREALHEKTEALKKAKEDFLKGKEANEKLREKELAEKELEHLQELVPSYEEKKEIFNRARKAATLEETEKTTRLRSQDKESCEKNLELKKKELEEIFKKYGIAEEKLKFQNQQEALREEAKKRVMQLEELTEKVHALEKQKGMLVQVKDALDHKMKEKAAWEQELQQLEERMEKENILLEELKEYGHKLPLLEAAYREAEKIYQKKMVLIQHYQDRMYIAKAYGETWKEYERIEVAYGKAKEEYFRLQEAWNKGQAAILAEQMEEGEPCPVCGSIHHPKPAEREAWMPMEAEVKEKRLEVEKLEKQKDKIKDVLAQKHAAKEKVENIIKMTEDELGEKKDEATDTLKKALEDGKNQWERAREKWSRQESVHKNILDMREKAHKIREMLQKAEEEIREKNGTYQNQVGALKEMENSIPEEVRSPEALKKAQTEASALYNSLREEFEKAQKDFEAMDKALAIAQNSLNSAEKALEEANEKYRMERQNFIYSMNRAGFEKYGDYASAKKKEEDIHRLEKEIKDFEGKFRVAKEHYEKTKKAVEGMAQVDLDKLQAQWSAMEKEKEEIIKLEGNLLQKIENDKKLLEEIQKLDRWIKNKEKEYETVGYLSDISNGNNAHGLTLQRFVLGALLDDITDAATQRLKLMSKGRYHLKRTMDRARKNAAGGLELEIFDTYTGMERPVTTLSGGETFLASLSLALGLADVVQSYSGGISLDTIFVDEGFGTLDPEALDFAMRTLIDLQQGGRLVGIISHVPELKERIDARLEVVPAQKGSCAYFMVHGK
ncbi:AAA family ATPase [Thermotalea metallivorans]|uniref:Nuclease SbcCD subunit C n=1 Tax=Thermotalea metallivorans TaxID=520762 RepID=A0A140L367_9FIRM|nr:SMC family ATPase [Thermotalea metallivorans]KXG74992.1 Nuclease SbcCD subunit C [Thermotalea metallivorans]